MHEVRQIKMASLKKSMPAEEALSLIGQECLIQLLGNQDIALRGDDQEGVHQMRVALRRLRLAISTFREIITPQEYSRFTKEIRWLSNILGVARDLDIFLNTTLPPVLEHVNHHQGLLILQDEAIAARKEAYAALRIALLSQRYKRLVDSLGCWLGNLPSNQSRITVKQIAEKMLRKRYKQLKRHRRMLAEANYKERHLARIAGKKLRYVSEFFQTLYPRRGSRQFIKTLSKLQDILGILNDITVTSSLVHRLAGSQPSKALGEAQHILNGWNSCRTMHHLTRIDKVLQAFVLQKPFWK